MTDPEPGDQIAWAADGYEGIVVTAPRRARVERDAFAQRVADIALLNRDVATLHAALRREFDGQFELDTGRRRGDVPSTQVRVTLLPPRGAPNPD